METVVLKLGGGAVTDKEGGRREARVALIKRVAAEIHRAQAAHEFRLIVVHGAGPFGHKLVADYHIQNGLHGKHAIEGFVRTHNSMEDLNKIFMDLFREEGLLGFPLQPSACLMQKDGRVEAFYLQPIEHLLALDKDIIPILYGDIVADITRGASVVSGDVIASELARALAAQRVLFGADVAGVFTADPKDNDAARLIPLITQQNLESVLKTVGGSKAIDVTRGMRGKIEAIATQLSGKEVLIFDLQEPQNLFRALTRQHVSGTTIRL